MDTGIYFLGLLAILLLVGRAIRAYRAWGASGLNAKRVLAGKIAGAFVGLAGGVLGGLASGLILELTNPEAAYIRASQEALWGGLCGLVLGGLVGVSDKKHEASAIGAVSGAFGGAFGGAIMAIFPGTTTARILITGALGMIAGAGVGALVAAYTGKLSQIIFRRIWGTHDI